MNTFAELQSREIETARAKHKPINSAHEGYSVILEELDEFWEEVRKKCSLRDKNKMVAELVQIAAMAQRTAEDVCMDRFAERPRSATRREGSPVSKIDANAGSPGAAGSAIQWLDWHSGRPHANPMASSLSAGHYCTGNFELGWVLYSRGGSCWHARTKPELPPVPGVVPVRTKDGWVWQSPNAPASATGENEKGHNHE